MTPFRSTSSKIDWSAFRIIAHRGARAVAPENTLSAITWAAEAGARSVELDVMLSADGVPIIIHDNDLARTTDGAGLVADHSFAAISKLDAGSWFDPAFAGEKIPALADAVALIRDRGMALNLEIKPSPGEDRATAARAIEILSNSWTDPAKLLLSSFSVEALEVARDQASRWQRGLIAHTPPADWRDVLADLGCVSLHCAAATATPSMIEETHAAGYKLLVWTVNSITKAATLFKNGADGIFTDDPSPMLAEFGA